MITANFYKFSKKENSTARPTGSGNALGIEIKSASSIFFPYIVVNRGASTAAPGYNYCYISNFERYYWITEWVWNDGLWEASLKCDVLATYKSVIGNENLYALRAAYSYDGSIPDTLYPAKAGCSFNSNALSANRPWGNPMAGVYVLGLVSKDADFGSIDYVIMSRANIKTFITDILTNAISDPINQFDINDASYALQAALIDPMQYIKSCTYIPFTTSELSSNLTTDSTVAVWSWEFPIANYKVNYASPYYSYSGTIDIPKHPQAGSRGQYVNQAPFTNLTLFAPPFGAFDLDTTSLVGATSLTLNVQIDLPTGLGILTVSNGSITLQKIEAQIGVPVQLSQVINDYAGAAITAAQGIAGAVGSAFSGNIGGAVSSLVTGAIGSATAALYPKAQSIGSGGSYAQLMGVWQICAQFFNVVDDDITHNGRPLCQVIQPKNIPGYILIQDGDVAIDGTQEESQEIKKYLETGFFYE